MRDEFEELLGAYALDACDPAEEAAIAQTSCRLPSVPGGARCFTRRWPASSAIWAARRRPACGDRIWGEIASPDQGDDTSEGEAAGETRLPRSFAHPPPPLAIIEANQRTAAGRRMSPVAPLSRHTLSSAPTDDGGTPSPPAPWPPRWRS